MKVVVLIFYLFLYLTLTKQYTSIIYKQLAMETQPIIDKSM